MKGNTGSTRTKGRNCANLLLSKNMTCVRPHCKATLCATKIALHTSHFILRTSRFTLHLISSHLTSSHVSFKFFPISPEQCSTFSHRSSASLISALLCVIQLFWPEKKALFLFHSCIFSLMELVIFHSYSYLTHYILNIIHTTLLHHSD